VRSTRSDGQTRSAPGISVHADQGLTGGLQLPAELTSHKTFATGDQDHVNFFGPLVLKVGHGPPKSLTTAREECLFDGNLRAVLVCSAEFIDPMVD